MGVTDISYNSLKTLALDTNIFIYALGRDQNKRDAASKLLLQIKETSPRVYISIIVIEEFFVRIYKEKKEQKVSEYLDFITHGGLITVVTIDRPIALKAAQIRARYGLKAPDAFHLATAIESKANIFITTDRRIPRKIDTLFVKPL